MAKNIKKNASGYNYKYTDLPSLNKWLEENGMDYYQYEEVIDGNDYIVTVPIIDGEEQPPRRGCRVVQATLSGKSNPAQEQGSAVTYARRYSLLMAFGLACTDDDAECMSRVPLKDRVDAIKKMVVQIRKEDGGDEWWKDMQVMFDIKGWGDITDKNADDIGEQCRAKMMQIGKEKK